MPKLYSYVAHSGTELRRETIEADSEKEVRAFLRGQGLVPMQIKPAKRPRRNLVAVVRKAFQPSDSDQRDKKKKASQKSHRYYFVAVPHTGGDAVRGEIIATDVRTARNMLREKGLTPSSVEPKKPWHEWMDRKARKSMMRLGEEKEKKQDKRSGIERMLDLIRPPQIGLKEMVYYTSQLSTMMDAGLAVSQALTILQGSVTHPRLKMINEEVRDKIYEGVGLGEAYAEHDRYLPPVFIELIAVGEASGNIEETLRRLADFLEKQLDTQAKIKSAMSYPTVLIGLIVLIVIGLMIFVVPTFLELFKEFKLELPWTTRTLLATSEFCKTKWWSLPLIGIGIYASIRWFFSTRFGKLVKDHMEYRIPLLGKLYYKVMVSRMLHNLSLFIRCGVTITTALENIRQGAQNRNIAFKIEEIRLGIVQGVRMSTLFEASALFPPFVNHLLAAGEEAGALDELMGKGARYVDQEIDSLVKALTAAIEPILTVMVAGIVLFILGSLYMPLFGLMGSGSKVSL